MSLAQVKEVLFQSNLNIDLSIVQQIYQFIVENKLIFQQVSLECYIMASTAIISQVKLIPNISNKGLKNNGMTIQKIMGYLPNISKEQYLDTISQLVRKYKSTNIVLLKKVQNVSLSYRLFKKYRKSFQSLWSLTGLGRLVANDLLSIFWVVYLFIKCKHNQKYHDMNYQIKLLIVLLKSVFEYWLYNIEIQYFNNVIRQIFGEYFLDTIKEDFIIFYQYQFSKLMQSIYKIHHTQELNLNRFCKDALQIAKFLDYICKIYEKQKEAFIIQNYIDQISYLQLKKVLVPKSLKKKSANLKSRIQKHTFNNDIKIQNQNQMMNSILNIQSSNSLSDSEQKYIYQQNLSNITPIRPKINSSGQTPCSNRINNLQWINKCIDNNKNNIQFQFKNIFQINNLNLTSSIYQKWSKQKLREVVQEYTPQCRKKQQRVNQIYSFFKYFVLRIYKNHNQDQNKKMFSNLNVLNSILCLSVDMFNYGYCSLYSSYRKLIKYFSITLTQALIPINWVGKNIQMPESMNNYLYLLQKRIVIQQIWQDSTGYDLIKSKQYCNQTKQISYTNHVIWGRLQKHILQRVSLLCKQVNIIDIKLIKRVQNMVSYLLKQKPYLLCKNKIDQIIICAITSFLSINQISQKKTLENVFQKYNNLQLSSKQNSQGLQGYGQQMTLVQFHNQVFLPEIQQIVRQNVTQVDFLTTPIRNKQYIGSTPFSKKYTQTFIYDGLQQKEQNKNKVDIKSKLGAFSKKLLQLRNQQGSGMQARQKLKIMRRNILTLNNTQLQQMNQIKFQQNNQMHQQKELQSNLMNRV